VWNAPKKDAAPAGIAVVVLSGLSRKNAEGLQPDRARAFLEKAELGVDKSCEAFLAALAEIVRELNLEVPKIAPARRG